MSKEWINLAFEDDVMDITCTASGDLSSYQYRLVKLYADNNVTLCSSATDPILGVLQNKPKDGQAARVRVMGISRVVAGGAVTHGDKLGYGTGAAGVAVTADKAVYIGIVTDGVGSGETISALIMGVPKTISAA